MSLKNGYKALIAQAYAQVKSYSIAEALAKQADTNVQLIDIRDVREIEREGMIPGAFHAPRGMIEFWADPDSPYHKPVFSSGKELVLYCSLGWRSSLTTKALQDMGFDNVAHIDGGFTGWKEAGHPVAQKEAKKV